LDYNDPSNDAYDDDGYGIFKVITENATFTNVDGGSVTNPRFIQMSKFSNHAGDQYIYSALLIKSPLKPGEEIELSFYTGTGNDYGLVGTTTAGTYRNDSFLAVYYEDDATKWENFSNKPMGFYDHSEQTFGKGIVPAGTSTNLGVTSGGFQYSTGRSDSSYSQARNSTNSANQLDGTLYVYNFPSNGTATGLSRFFRITIKNNSSKPAMLKLIPNNTTASGVAQWIRYNLYDLQTKLTSPSGGIVKKENLRGASVIGSNASNSLSLGGSELVITSTEGSHRIFTHSDLLSGPAMNAQYFLHNVHGHSGNYAAATGIFLSLLPNPGVHAPAAADFELRSPYVFMAPKNGRFVCTKLLFNSLQSGTIKVSVYAYSTKTTVGDALTSGFASYLPGGATHSHLNTSVTNARNIEATWGTNSTFSAGDLIWVGVEFPTAARTINGYTVIEWTD